ncbi:MAG: CBASS cGAMP-activated phospholipase [Kiritimatiellae bacterium]|nr:CBASS cGAMP-activated phospholipase [Kiritimatiellia bacterium]
MSIKRFQILALDGGGLKGLFAAAVLAKIEEDLGGDPIARHFDLITGTSTGGIIAIGLALGLRPNELVEFYVQHGGHIFPQECLARTCRTIQQLFKSKYDNKTLICAVKECFGDKLLGHSQTRLVIPSYNLAASTPYLFKTAHHPDFKRDYKVPAWKVAVATSSAPTYLPAFTHVDSIRLIDGGVWANNPAMVGLVEAIGKLKIPIEDVSVLSLGTIDEIKDRPRKLDRGGLWQWKNHAADVIMGGQSAGTDQHVGLLLGDHRYLRLNPIVPSGFYKLDRLSVDEHLALAAHYSRHVIADVQERFTEHIAETFTPIFNLRGDL